MIFTYIMVTNNIIEYTIEYAKCHTEIRDKFTTTNFK